MTRIIKRILLLSVQLIHSHCPSILTRYETRCESFTNGPSLQRLCVNERNKLLRTCNSAIASRRCRQDPLEVSLDMTKVTGRASLEKDRMLVNLLATHYGTLLKSLLMRFYVNLHRCRLEGGAWIPESGMTSFAHYEIKEKTLLVRTCG